jgi:group I intron endonuclease
VIYRAILKYGVSEFSFEIIEYCEPSIFIKKEQYNIDLIYPEYNILKFARNSK